MKLDQDEYLINNVRAEMDFDFTSPNGWVGHVALLEE